MKEIITAQKFFDKMIAENEECTSTEMMIRFAKIHVYEALNLVSINAEARYYLSPESYVLCPIEEDSVFNSYPLTTIK